MKVSDTVLHTIADTTRNTGSSRSGTIVAKKKGDWIWWVLCIALIIGAVYLLLHPALLRAIFV